MLQDLLEDRGIFVHVGRIHPRSVLVPVVHGVHITVQAVIEGADVHHDLLLCYLRLAGGVVFADANRDGFGKRFQGGVQGIVIIFEGGKDVVGRVRVWQMNDQAALLDQFCAADHHPKLGIVRPRGGLDSNLAALVAKKIMDIISMKFRRGGGDYVRGK